MVRGLRGRGRGGAQVISWLKIASGQHVRPELSGKFSSQLKMGGHGKGKANAQPSAKDLAALVAALQQQLRATGHTGGGASGRSGGKKGTGRSGPEGPGGQGGGNGTGNNGKGKGKGKNPRLWQCNGCGFADNWWKFEDCKICGQSWSFKPAGGNKTKSGETRQDAKDGKRDQKEGPAKDGKGPGETAKSGQSSGGPKVVPPSSDKNGAKSNGKVLDGWIEVIKRHSKGGKDGKGKNNADGATENQPNVKVDAAPSPGAGADEDDDMGYQTADDKTEGQSGVGKKPGTGGKSEEHGKAEPVKEGDPALEAQMVEEGLQAIQVLERMGLLEEREALQKMHADLRRHREALQEGKPKLAAEPEAKKDKPLDIQLRKIRSRMQRLAAKKESLLADEAKLREVLTEVEGQLYMLGERLQSIDDDLEDGRKAEKEVAWELAKETGAIEESSPEASSGEESCMHWEDEDDGEDHKRRVRKKRRRKTPANDAETVAAPQRRGLPGLAEELLVGLRADATQEATSLHGALQCFVKRAGIKVSENAAKAHEGAASGSGPKVVPATPTPQVQDDALSMASNLVLRLDQEIGSGNEWGTPLLEALRVYQKQMQEIERHVEKPTGKMEEGASAAAAAVRTREQNRTNPY